MDIRQLHYFLVLCEEMNYTRAAQRLFLSRQALRQSISALEAELCGPLFLSAHHKLSLTDRGVSLQRHAAPVVEQFQQMQAALRAEIQSAQPVRIGISVALVPDYLPGLETQLDKFRQQYPHIEMRFRLLDNDAVAEGVEQGELDAGLVIDLGCAAPVLARTTLRADPACLLVPRGHPFWEKERIPLAELRGQRVLLPSLRQDLFSPLWDACAREGFAPNVEIGPSFYQAYYLVQEQLCTCLTRYEPGARRELDRVRDVLLEDLPPLCVSMVQRRDHNSAYLDLLRGYLMEVIGGAASLPPRRGRPAKPFYNFPVLSSAAPKAAPQHPAPGTQLPFAGGNNFRELGGYEADEGKHVKWGQIYRGIPTGLLTGAADRKLLDSLGLRLILDLRSESEAAEQPDYVPDGARLVRICGLCHPDGSEISFSPGDIEKLLKGKKDEEHNLADAMYEQMLFRNKAYKELFRALEAGETPILFHCSGGKDRTGVAAMLILLAGIIFNKLLLRTVDRLLLRSASLAPIQRYLRSALSVLLWLVLILVVLGSVGVEMTSIIALLSVAGLAVSLALQNTLSNLAGGITLLASKPFTVGDYVEIGSVSGTVSLVGLAYTTLVTVENKEIYIPNSQLSSATIINYTRLGRRRMEITVSASYDAPTEAVKAALGEAVAQFPQILPDPAPEIHLSGYGASGIDYLLRAWTSSGDYWDVYYGVMEGVRPAFARRGVEMPYGQLDVHLIPRSPQD